ncbi:MAG: hypothetical protein SGJ01_00970 [Gemmatimonadota bacterium]|nr:hypothetical protein [Gemmatimonadota bacterium]
MTRLRPACSLLATALLVGAIACSDTVTDNGGNPVPADSLTFLRLAPTAPLLCADTVSALFTKGVGKEIALTFPETGNPADCGGSGEDEDFVRLKLDGQSLLNYPDGTPFQNGDTVTITIAWVGSDSILFHLEPTGLSFDPGHQAELKIEYGEAGSDLNQDGNTDAADDQIEQEIDIWRQPTLVDDYTKVGTAKLEATNEIEAKLNGFSRYAIAY